MDEIQEILARDLRVSTKRGVFSTPKEITDYVNSQLDSDFSVKRISIALQGIGWQPCKNNRARRQGITCGYYFKSNTKRKALIAPNAGTKSARKKSKGEDESLADIDRRFKAARADKERALANTRDVETETARIKARHEEIKLAKFRGEYILVEDVKREWASALVHLKTVLYTLPDKFSQQWASLSDDKIIHASMIHELDNLCRRLADAGEKAVSQDTELEDDNEVDSTQDRDSENDSKVE